MKKPVADIVSAKRSRKSAGVATVRAGNAEPAPIAAPVGTSSRRRRTGFALGAAEAHAALRARVDRELADVSGYAELSPFRKARLVAELLRAMVKLEGREKVRKIPTDPAARRALKRIGHSVAIVAAFNTDTPLGAKALDLLADAGDEWKSKRNGAADRLPRGFAEPFLEVRGFILDFVHAAQVMHEIIKKAGTDPKEQRPPKEERRPVQDGMRLREDWLPGAELPRIYNRTFSDEFTATPETEPTRLALSRGSHATQASNGIRFVKASLAALGLPRLSDQTIRKYCSSARSAGIGA